MSQGANLFFNARGSVTDTLCQCALPVCQHEGQTNGRIAKIMAAQLQQAEESRKIRRNETLNICCLLSTAIAIAAAGVYLAALPWIYK